VCVLGCSAPVQQYMCMHCRAVQSESELAKAFIRTKKPKYVKKAKITGGGSVGTQEAEGDVCVGGEWKGQGQQPDLTGAFCCVVGACVLK
jgi:hypothetical protein